MPPPIPPQPQSSVGSAIGPCGPLDCYAACRAADIEQQKKCAELDKSYGEKMGADGCPGTKCKTKPFAKSCRKPKRACPKKKSKVPCKVKAKVKPCKTKGRVKRMDRQECRAATKAQLVSYLKRVGGYKDLGAWNKDNLRSECMRIK